jgi:signal transduction histidine kinase
LERAEAWCVAAHDLRGSAHVIANATAVLNCDGIPDQKRTQFAEVLRVGVESLDKLLTDLMDQARLEAGYERAHVEPFDAAVLLKSFCDITRPLAAERNLFLKAEGPGSLMV